MVAKDCGFWQYARHEHVNGNRASGRETAPAEQKQLLRFLLRAVPVNEVELPGPRIFSAEEIPGWLAEDEASLRRFCEGT